MRTPPGIIAAAGAGSAPPIPDFTGTVSAWGLFNWAGVGGGAGVNYENAATDPFDALFEADAPYELDWTLTGSAPYLVNTWVDQNAAANNLTQTGAARPVLDATDKQITFNGSSQGLAGANPLLTP